MRIYIMLLQKVCIFVLILFGNCYYYDLERAEESTTSTETVESTNSTKPNDNVGVIVGVTVSVSVVVILVVTGILLYCFCRGKISEKIKSLKKKREGSVRSVSIIGPTLTRTNDVDHLQARYVDVGSQNGYLNPVNISMDYTESNHNYLEPTDSSNTNSVVKQDSPNEYYTIDSVNYK